MDKYKAKYLLFNFSPADAGSAKSCVLFIFRS